MNAVPGATRRRRTAAFGAIAVTAALLTSACAAGRVAQTANQRPSIAGVNAQVGTMAIRDLSIEAPPQGTYYPTGSALRLTGVFVNNGTSSDLLTDISASSVTGWGAYSSITDGDQVVAAASASAAGTTPSAASSPAGVPVSASAPTSASSIPSSTTSPDETSSGPAPSSDSSSPSDSSSSSSDSATPSAAPTTASLPQAAQTVRVPNGSRTVYGTPTATGALLLLGTKSRLYPGTTVTLTLTFARAGTVSVAVPIQITTDPTQAVVEAPSGSDAGD